MDFLTLLKLKWDILKNKIFYIRRESGFKISVIIIFIIGYGIGSFWVFLRGFDYVSQTMGIGYFILDRLFYVFFMVLFFMLAISQLIITYSSFYKNPEVEFFFSLPISYPAIYSIKFLESTLISSWAFLFLTIPLLGAYGVSRSLGPGFYLIGAGLSVPFIFITAGIGTSLGVLLVKYFPRRFLRIIVITALITGISLLIFYHRIRHQMGWQTSDLGILMDQLLRHTRISLFPALPSYWVSKALLSVISREWGEVTFYFLVLLSTSLFITWGCLQFGRKLHFYSWQMLKEKPKRGVYFPKRGSGCLCRWRIGTLILRDLKLFRRDPVQWSQFAIFFGMLGVYIMNLRQMHYDFESVFWKNLISFLNLGTISLTLGTLTTRFIFPQWSLEHKRMWVLGLTPISVGKILLVKFFTSSGLCLLITFPLIIGSNIMLRVPPYMMWLSLGTVAIMNLSLPALALGLGAIFPNTKEDDMPKIVSGFGGTLTLVLSLSYIISVIAIEALPVHLYFAKKIISQAIFYKWITLTAAGVVLISGITIILPLVLGWRNLLKMEY